MAAITTKFGTGGANLTPDGSSGSPTLAGALRDVATDLGVLRTSITGITAQLDLDAGVTDTTYASGNDPVALLTTAP